MTEQIQKTDTQNREIEEVFQELDTIAEKLESGDTSLEDSFRLYKKGMELLKYCSDRLDTCLLYTSIKILLLILLSAVLANFADVFVRGRIGDNCFYIVYLLLFILLMDSFSSVTRSVQQTITWMAEFMRGLAPAYFLTISIAAGSSTAAVFYEGVLILTWLIQEVILNLLFPGACLYLSLIHI